jgi:putative membrane protein
MTQTLAQGTIAHGVLAAAAYAVLGIVILILAFVIMDRLTPGSLWQEIMERQNRALAILAGCMAIGISIIIAAAVV